MEQNVQQRLLEELMKLAFSDASDAAGAPIKSSSKLKALELLGRNLGMFEGTRKGAPVTVVEDV